MTLVFLNQLLRSVAELVAWQSLAASLVWVGAACVALGLRRTRPDVVAAVWGLVLLRLVLPPSLSSPLGVGSLLAQLGVSTSPATGPLDGVTAGVIQGLPVLDTSLGLFGLWSVVGLLWFVGVVVAAGRFYRRWSAVRRAVATSRPLVDAEVLAEVEAWRHRLGVRRQVDVRVSPDEIVPFAFGVVRPRIVLPEGVLSRSGIRSSVIGHEMGHIRRFDVVWLTIEQVLGTLFFFHPLVRHTLTQRDGARERACDLLAVRAGGLEPRRYARDVLGVVEMGLAAVGAPSMADPAAARRLRDRLEAVLHSPRESRIATRLGFVVVAASGLFLLPVAGAAVARGIVTPSPPTFAPPSVETHGRDWLDPLPGGRVTWGWGQGRDPFTGEVRHHAGVDLAAQRGAPVRATAAGTVVVATDSWKESPASGTVVLLDHGDGWMSLYSHLDQTLVQVGALIAAGEPIARVGSTGRSTGPHLHFEIRHGGVAVDPATLVAGLARSQTTDPG